MQETETCGPITTLNLLGMRPPPRTFFRYWFVSLLYCAEPRRSSHTRPAIGDRELADRYLFTQECPYISTYPTLPSSLLCFTYPPPLIAAPRRPIQPAPDGPIAHILDEDIPPELLNEIAAFTRGGASDGDESAGGQVCPQCKFENTHSRNDCDVCGLRNC